MEELISKLRLMLILYWLITVQKLLIFQARNITLSPLITAANINIQSY